MTLAEELGPKIAATAEKWNDRLRRRHALIGRGLSPAWYQILHDYWQQDGGLLERIEAMSPEEIANFNNTITLEQVIELREAAP